MELITLISVRIKELRYRHGLTQEETAELIGVSMRHYQSIEAGQKKQIWLGTVEMLAHAFCLEPWQLIGPELPEQTKPRFKVVKSSIHNHRHRKGPYQRKAGAISSWVANAETS